MWDDGAGLFEGDNPPVLPPGVLRTTWDLAGKLDRFPAKHIYPAGFPSSENSLLVMEMYHKGLVADNCLRDPRYYSYASVAAIRPTPPPDCSSSEASGSQPPSRPLLAIEPRRIVRTPQPAARAPARRHQMTCNFCKISNQPEEVYNSHCLRDRDGVLQCPILMAYVCPYCSATGIHAHTRCYCPVLRRRMESRNSEE